MNFGLQDQIDDLRGMMETILNMVQQNGQQTMDAGVAQSNVNNQRTNENASPATQSVSTNAYVGGFRSIKEIADMIPEFDPTNKQSLTVQQFVDRVGSVMNAYQLEEKCVLVAVYGRLKGVARVWLDAQPTVHTSWNDFAKALKHEFCVSYDEAQVHRIMSESGRKTGERISDYCFRVYALGKRFQLSESAIIQYTRQGLNHRDLQMAIASQRFESAKQMREIIEEWLTNRFDGISGKQNFETQATIKNAPRQQTASGESRKIVCYNCGEVGHISSKCTKEQKRSRCTDCGKVHKREDPVNCGRKQATHNARKAEMTQNEKCFVKKINVNGKMFEALIDTGSECSLVRKSTADMLKVECEDCFTHLNGISGGRYTMRERCMCDIVIGKAKVSTLVYIVADNMLQTDFLLGQDILARKGLLFMVENGESKLEAECRYGVALPNDECFAKLTNNVSNEDQRLKLQALLKNYNDLFSDGLKGIGKSHLIEMKIVLKSEKVITQAPYRVPAPKRMVITQMIKNLEENDIIAKSSSEFASPIVLVKRKMEAIDFAWITVV